MPGIGVLPMGTLTAFNEMPGGIFADGGSGLAERPGGIFAGSSFISLFSIEVEFELEFALDGPLEPQPKTVKSVAEPNKIAVFLNIIRPLTI